MNRLYANPLSVWMNLYQPSVKLIKTIHIGSKTKKIYSAPQTPLDRLAEYNPALAKDLIKLWERLNPFELSAKISQLLEKIWKTANLKPKTRILAKTKVDIVNEALVLSKKRSLTSNYG